MAKSKLVPALLIGATVGAVISMFDKSTREHTVQTVNKVKETVTYYSQNRDELQSLISSKVEQVQSLYSSAQENIQSLVGDSSQESSPIETITTLISETREAFSNK